MDDEVPGQALAAANSSIQDKRFIQLPLVHGCNIKITMVVDEKKV
jgi:hypothetical protein